LVFLTQGPEPVTGLLRAGDAQKTRLLFAHNDNRMVVAKHSKIAATFGVRLFAGSGGSLASSTFLNSVSLGPILRAVLVKAFFSAVEYLLG
jgi:hypothetical protein